MKKAFVMLFIILGVLSFGCADDYGRTGLYADMIAACVSAFLCLFFIMLFLISLLKD
jgi:hypothetical protein